MSPLFKRKKSPKPSPAPSTAASMPMPTPVPIKPTTTDELIGQFGRLGVTERPAGPHFVGGFAPTPTPPPTSSSAPPASQGPAFPTAWVPAIPRPPAMSLTMQYAQSDASLPPPRPPHSRPVSNPETLTAAAAVTAPATPPRKNNAHLHPASATPVTPGRARVSSTPASPTASPTATSVQCSGMTKAETQCTRMVKNDPSSMLAGLPLYCHQHQKDVLEPKTFYATGGPGRGKELQYKDWIPEDLHPDTQAAMRSLISKPRSAADVPGYIYVFEIKDRKRPNTIDLKVGRAVNVTKRLHQWSKQCGSKEQVPRGFWPGTIEDPSISLLKGTIEPGPEGECCHRLESLVHLELADMSINEQYLKRNKKQSSSSLKTPSDLKGKKQQCPDCGKRHREIFSFTRIRTGEHAFKEYEQILVPVLTKWGHFVNTYI